MVREEITVDIRIFPAHARVVVLFDRRDSVYSFNGIPLHVCLPLCIMGMNPEYCSFALHVCDSDVIGELNKDERRGKD